MPGGVRIPRDAEAGLVTDVRPIHAERRLLEKDKIHCLVAGRTKDRAYPISRNNAPAKIGGNCSKHAQTLAPTTDTRRRSSRFSPTDIDLAVTIRWSGSALRVAHVPAP